MSKERARRRTAREAAHVQARAKRAAQVARRERRRALLRRLTPRLPDRRTGTLLARRNGRQRLLIALFLLLAIGFVWWQLDGLATRLAVTALILVTLPAVIIISFDRRL